MRMGGRIDGQKVYAMRRHAMTQAHTLSLLVSMRMILSRRYGMYRTSCANTTSQKTNMRYQGKIINWRDDKGFGFIAPKGGGKEVFVHIKAFANRQRRPLENESVTYELKTDAKGRLQAECVGFVGDRMTSTSLSGRNNFPLVTAAAFLVFVASSSFAGKFPFTVFWFYTAASVVTFIAYTLDKSAARNDRWRTKESTLHLFALVGGWPGALAAQRLLRHKSRKQSFQMVFWLTVILNCSALGWLFSATGAQALRSALVHQQSLNVIRSVAHKPEQASHVPARLPR